MKKLLENKKLEKIIKKNIDKDNELTHFIYQDKDDKEYFTNRYFILTNYNFLEKSFDLENQTTINLTSSKIKMSLNVNNVINKEYLFSFSIWLNKKNISILKGLLATIKNLENNRAIKLSIIEDRLYFTYNNYNIDFKYSIEIGIDEENNFKNWKQSFNLEYLLAFLESLAEGKGLDKTYFNFKVASNKPLAVATQNYYFYLAGLK